MNRAGVCIGIFSLVILGASARAEEKLYHSAAAIQKANAGVIAETPNAQRDPSLSIEAFAEGAAAGTIDVWQMKGIWKKK